MTVELPQPRIRVCRPPAGFLVLLLACGGCGRGAQSFVPAEATARKALETALTAWKNGRAVGAIEGGDLPIQVLDSAWYKGHKLDSFEVLGDETDADGKRWYTVRLHMRKPPGTQTVRYLVTGRAALWIYREEDYKRSRNWEGFK